AKASVETFKSAEYRVHGNTADERCQYKRIRNTPITNIVISNDDRQGDEKNHVYKCYGHPFLITSACLLKMLGTEMFSQALTTNPSGELLQPRDDCITQRSERAHGAYCDQGCRDGIFRKLKPSFIEKKLFHFAPQSVFRKW